MSDISGGPSKTSASCLTQSWPGRTRIHIYIGSLQDILLDCCIRQKLKVKFCFLFSKNSVLSLNWQIHPWKNYLLSKSIETQLDHIIADTQRALRSCCVDYGTIRQDTLDEDFDALFHRDVLAVEMGVRSMGRWGEFDGWIGGFMERACGMLARQAPPIGYYVGGFGFL